LPHALATSDNLQWPDYLAAVLAHLLLATIFLVMAHSTPTPPPPRHPVQVQLITSHPPAHKKTIVHHKKPTPKKTVHKKVIHKKVVKKHLATKPKPVLKHHKKAVKPKVQARSKPKKLDFDPFAPQQSTTNAPTQARKHHRVRPTSLPTTDNPLTHGMTNQEINRYIARIQRQVQNQWKVPAKSPKQLNDPEVLLRLNRDGSIAQISISTSSGDPIMDHTLIKAIQAAAPFDLPPNNFDLFQVNRMTFHPLR